MSYCLKRNWITAIPQEYEGLGKMPASEGNHWHMVMYGQTAEYRQDFVSLVGYVLLSTSVTVYKL